MFYYAYEKEEVNKKNNWVHSSSLLRRINKRHCPLSVVHDFLNRFKNFGWDFYLKLSTAPIFLFSFHHGAG